MMTTLTIGLISDTHIPRRMKRLPDAALRAMDGADLILHAGDVDDPAALAPLRAIAPVHAVRGNIHFHEFSDGGAALPAVVELSLAGQHVVLTHGHRLGPRGFWLKGRDAINRLFGLADNGVFNQNAIRRLAQSYPEADIVVFGHTHRALVKRVGHTLFINPGAVCSTWNEQPSVARMRLGENEVQAEIVPLLTGSR
jgi:uncharacterized protein